MNPFWPQTPIRPVAATVVGMTTGRKQKTSSQSVRQPCHVASMRAPSEGKGEGKADAPPEGGEELPANHAAIEGEPAVAGDQQHPP